MLEIRSLSMNSINLNEFDEMNEIARYTLTRLATESRRRAT